MEAIMSRKPPENLPKQLTAAQLRERRLAEALRANLKRRKALGRTGPQNTSGKPEAGED